MIRALRATESERRSHNPFDFGKRIRFDAATVTKIKISPGTPKAATHPETAFSLCLNQAWRIVAEATIVRKGVALPFMKNFTLWVTKMYPLLRNHIGIYGQYSFDFRRYDGIPSPEELSY